MGMSERMQFENRSISVFETLNGSHQALLDEVQEDLEKPAQEQAQKAQEQVASNSATTPLPADMVAQAAQAVRTIAKASYIDQIVPAVPLPRSKHSRKPVQAPIQESVQQPPQELVSMEDTLACVGANGAAGPRDHMSAEEAPDVSEPLDSHRSQVPSRYLLRHSAHDRPEISGTTESSPRLGSVTSTAS